MVMTNDDDERTVAEGIRQSKLEMEEGRRQRRKGGREARGSWAALSRSSHLYDPLH